MERHKDRLFWSQVEPYNFGGGLSWNRNLNWSKELLEQFKDRWSWSFLTGSILGEYIWYEGILDDFSEYIHWSNLSLNSEVPWSESVIEQYKDQLVWSNLSGSYKLPWSAAFIEKYEDRIDFQQMSRCKLGPLGARISSNYSAKVQMPTVFESIETVERFEHLWDWENINWDWDHGLEAGMRDQLVQEMLENAPVISHLHADQSMNTHFND